MRGMEQRLYEILVSWVGICINGPELNRKESTKVFRLLGLS